MSFDPQAVRAFEHAGWQRAAAGYGATFARATSGFIEALLDAAWVRTGVQILDLACGPGLVANMARERGAVPTGLDFSSAMVGLARTAHPEIRFERRRGRRAAVSRRLVRRRRLEFRDPPRAGPRPRAIRGATGAETGWAMAFTSWAAPAENIAWKLLLDAISAHGNSEAAKTPPSGGGLRDPADLLRVLTAAGFAETEARRVNREWRFAAAGDLIEGFRRGTVRTAALINAQPPTALPAIGATITQSLAAYRRPEGFAVPLVAILGSALRP